MSSTWQSGVDTQGRPSLPAGAIASANTGTADNATGAPQLVGVHSAQPHLNGTASPIPMSNGSVAPGALAGAGGEPNGDTLAVNQNGKRGFSPDRTDGGAMPPHKTIKSSHAEDVKPVIGSQASAATSTAPAASGVQFLGMARGQGIDLKAEEENQRRAARMAVGPVRYAGSNRAKHTDLFGERALRIRLHQIAQEHAMTVDDEAMRYLALAAEVRVRSLLSSSIRAQVHRVTSTHKYPPPMRTAAGGSAPRPLWSQKITSDPNAVLAALEAQNKEETKAHRIARTEWRARQTEQARAIAAAREREEREREREGGSNPTAAASPAEDTEAPASGSAAAAAAAAPKAPTFQAAPTFGAAPPPKKPSKAKKSSTKWPSDALQHKSTNSTAFSMIRGKKYDWVTGGTPANWKTKKDKKDKVEGESSPAPEVVKPKRVRRRPSSPKPREIDVATPGDKRSNDRQALTLADVVFALEHDGEKGAGSSEEIARRIWARPGGPYGSGR